MGKHIKTKIDYDMIDELGKELYSLDPNNKILNKFLSMDNFEGKELRKSVSNVTPSKEYGILCTDCRKG
jgi:hypothetical protein